MEKQKKRIKYILSNPEPAFLSHSQTKEPVTREQINKSKTMAFPVPVIVLIKDWSKIFV